MVSEQYPRHFSQDDLYQAPAAPPMYTPLADEDASGDPLGDAPENAPENAPGDTAESSSTSIGEGSVPLLT